MWEGLHLLAFRRFASQDARDGLKVASTGFREVPVCPTQPLFVVHRCPELLAPTVAPTPLARSWPDLGPILAHLALILGHLGSLLA